MPAGPVLEQVAEQALAIAPSRPEPAQPSPKPARAAEATSMPKPANYASVRTTPRAKPGIEPIIAEPPLPDDPGPEPEPSAPPRKRFRLFDWLARASP
jgi:hypothetical protein